MNEPIFAAAQLEDHRAWPARAWHLTRKVLGVGWRTITGGEHATFTGTVVKGETDPDGDTNFDLYVLPFLTLHCEVDPADLATLRPALLQLRPGGRVSVTGRFCLDLGHSHLEIHPVEAIHTEEL